MEYSVSLRIHSACGKIQTRKTPNTDTFHAVNIKYESDTKFPQSPELSIMTSSILVKLP